ncbi:MAG: hypothetical protein PF482_08705 [Desulfobacteraceae bacterium]|jgi:ferritin-like metal-binding protein YciE|nr:hypothetical protein [Desulfobacteraceae bacterium]
MPKSKESKNIKQLMAEADELIRHINSEAVKNMEETHRLEFKKHAQNLDKIKSVVQGKTGRTGLSEIESSTDGMHEAIQDIVKAFQELKKNHS